MKQNQICEIYLYHNIFYKSVIIKHIIQVVFRKNSFKRNL